MKRFPREFADLMNRRGLRLLNGGGHGSSTPLGGGNGLALFDNIIDKKSAAHCANILDIELFPFLCRQEYKIEREWLSGMTENYSERLGKTMNMKTAFLRRKAARSYDIAARIGLLEMMRSESLVRFAEVTTGRGLIRELDVQVICYEQGDYAGPHNDHHPESEMLRDGYVDIHLSLANDAVAHHYLVYEEKGHFSKVVNVSRLGCVAVYELPFWHYTTPLVGKRNREHQARRWVLLSSLYGTDRESVPRAK
jgi:hypothetical protein